MDYGFEVLPVASGRAAAFLQSELNEAEIINIEGHNIQYPDDGNMRLSMLKQAPSLLRSIAREHRQLEHAVGKYKVQAVLSDNRFGMWSKQVPSIYMTHQVMIKAPGKIIPAERILHLMHSRYMRHFDECWIPDFKGDGGLAGDLSHKWNTPVPSYFIGPQSRFDHDALPGQKIKYEIMAIISGPEPQRSIFEKMLVSQLKESGLKAILALGKPELGKEVITQGNIDIYPHMNTEEMQQAILSSKLIIGRPGYSSIMDLAVLGKPAILVPTPGQTEQEYLADYHMSKRHFYSVSQHEFDLTRLLRLARNYPGINIKADQAVLNERIEQLIRRL
jgi:UDP:flavonoid glycosyltransferase YjiC (YdhE family)